MDAFEIFALFVSLAALASYANHRFLRLPTSVALMASGAAVSLLLVAGGDLWPGIHANAVELIDRTDFDFSLMHALLGFLLFAGALHVEFEDLQREGVTIALLASVGLVISTTCVGLATWGVSGWLGLGWSPWLCLLFGALISPTDPIAVLAILKTLGAPRSLETKIAGESLFNDGVAVVVFLAVAGAAGLDPRHGAEGMGVAGVARLFVVEAGGGVLFGLLLGGAGFWLFRSVDQYEVEILLSLAIVAGGYALAQVLHVSGPISMVVAGLCIGNQGRRLAMSAHTREHLDTFWQLLDEVLNALLFLWIGLEVLVLRFDVDGFLATLLLLPCVVGARWIAVGAPLTLMKRFRDFAPHAVTVLTWGGLRGGISIALALSLEETLGARSPQTFERLLAMTYGIVAFSILAQGTTMPFLLRRLGLAGSPEPEAGVAPS